MKMQLTRFVLCVWASMACTVAFAQDNINETAIRLEKKVEKNGFQMTVNATAEVVATAIQNKLKTLGVRAEERRGTYTAKAATIGAISAKALDFTIITDENRKSKTTTIAVVAMMGYDVVVNSRDYPTEAQNIRGFLTSLREDIRVEALNARIKEETEKLVEFERALKKLNDRKISLEKDIQDYMQKIENAKNEAAKTTTELDNMRLQVDNQRQAIEKIKKEF
jgi:outer membrane murein-binding lipoprotein Lpp